MRYLCVSEAPNKSLLSKQNAKTNFLNQAECRCVTNPQVKYECVYKTELFDDGLLLRVCERTKRALRCEAPKKLTIVSANYGRLSGGHICPGPVKTRNCGAAGSLGKVTRDCQGKQECILEATNAQFGDPCVGTRKYLEVRIIQ